MNSLNKVFIFEDKWVIAEGVAHVLAEHGFEVCGSYSRVPEFLEALALNQEGAIGLIDLEADEAGFEMLVQAQRSAPKAKLLGMSLWSPLHDGVRMFVSANTNIPVVHPLRISRVEMLAAIDSTISGAAPALDVHPTQLNNPVHPLERLSAREREVLCHVASGADNLKISAMLGITERTVKAHVSALYRKLNLDNRTELALAALKNGVRLPNHLQGW